MPRWRPPDWSPPFFCSCGPSDTISERHVTEAAVMPLEIEQLADLSGYLKYASRLRCR
jgi:hypothetical protein